MRKIRIFLWFLVVLLFFFINFFLIKKYYYEPNPQKLQNFSKDQNFSKNDDFLDSIENCPLVDHNGNNCTLNNFNKNFMLVYFGYSFCPNICPTALHNISKALNKLGKDSFRVQPIFITIDPSRDTVSQMHAYKKNFHESFVMLTGSQVEINQIKNLYKVYSESALGNNKKDNYLLNHSSIIYFVGSEGNFIFYFNHETPVEEIVSKIYSVF